MATASHLSSHLSLACVHLSEHASGSLLFSHLSSHFAARSAHLSSQLVVCAAAEPLLRPRANKHPNINVTNWNNAFSFRSRCRQRTALATHPWSHSSTPRLLPRVPLLFPNTSPRDCSRTVEYIHRQGRYIAWRRNYFSTSIACQYPNPEIEICRSMFTGRHASVLSPSRSFPRELAASTPVVMTPVVNSLWMAACGDGPLPAWPSCSPLLPRPLWS